MVYAVTYPRDHFIAYDLQRSQLTDYGRIGSVNTQCIFLDRRGRAYFFEDSGRLLRFDPEGRRIERLKHVFPHAPYQSAWHGVLYDAAQDPTNGAIYMVPWKPHPHLARFWPEEGADGHLEDLGPLTQERDEREPMSVNLDHVGGLVFGPDAHLFQFAPRSSRGYAVDLGAQRAVKTHAFEESAAKEFTNSANFMREKTYRRDITQHMQSVKLVGSSGAGKSTFAQLLLRLYDPTEGRVLFDDHDLRNFRGSQLRKRLGVVPQDPYFFRATIRENLEVAAPNASREALVKACREANAWEFIQQIPLGLDSMLGEGGTTLSGGQRQRLAIARALLADPRLFHLR